MLKSFSILSDLSCGNSFMISTSSVSILLAPKLRSTTTINFFKYENDYINCYVIIIFFKVFQKLTKNINCALLRIYFRGYCFSLKLHTLQRLTYFQYFLYFVLYYFTVIYNICYTLCYTNDFIMINLRYLKLTLYLYSIDMENLRILYM